MADQVPATADLDPAPEEQPDGPECPTCDTFEPQAWRKSLCRNCFHALDEHAEDLLAAEGRAMAREKATSGKPASSSASSASPAEPKEAPKTAPKPDMKTKGRKSSGKDAKDSPHSSTSSSSSTSSAGREAPKSAREKFLEKVSKSSEKPSGPGKESSAAGKIDRKDNETKSSSSTSTSSVPPKSSLKSTQSSSSPSTSSPPSASGKPISDSNPSSQKASKLKEAASAMESKLSPSKPGPSKPQEVRIPGMSGSSLSSKLSAFTDKSRTPDNNKKTQDTKSSGRTSTEALKPSQSSKLNTSKKEPETKESNVASKFAKFGGGKVKESQKGSDEDLKSKLTTQTSAKKELAKSDTLSKSSSKEKDSVNKGNFASTKQSRESSSSKTDLHAGPGRNTEPNSSKETGSAKLSSDNERKQTVAKKTASGEKTPTKLNTKSESSPSKPVGSSTAKPGEGTAQSAVRKGAGGGNSASVSQVNNGPSDVTSTSQVRSTAGGIQRSPKSGLSSVSEGKEKREKDASTPQSGAGQEKASDDKNTISRESSGVDLRNKHSPRACSSSPSADTIRPGPHDPGDQSTKAPADRGSGGRDKPSQLSLENSGSANARSTSSPLSSGSGNSKSTPSPLSSSSGNTRSPPSPLDVPAKSPVDSKSKSQTPTPLAAAPTKSENDSKHGSDGGPTSRGEAKGEKTGELVEQGKLKDELKKRDEELKKRDEVLKEREEELRCVKLQLSAMEERLKDQEAELEKSLQEQRKETGDDDEKKTDEKTTEDEPAESQQGSPKKDLDSVEARMSELQAKLDERETQCERLTSDNHDLREKLKSGPPADNAEKTKREKELAVLEQDLEAAERELEETREDNRELKRQVMEMRNEMDEMTDSFRESELEEFREMQRELEMASKNCRILQFKLRKSERRNIQTEEDRANYEEKLRQLEAQFDSQDARNHIQVLEEELRLAKEVSVRLHDELDIVEDKRLKAMEENRHLTELLEHTDKRQFRMEMEIDKLRDMVSKVP